MPDDSNRPERVGGRASVRAARVGEVARVILEYLADHPSAWDTLEGVGQWWLSGQRASLSDVTAALEALVAEGRVERVEHPSEVTFRVRRVR